jgi:hypothetical protein
VNSLRRAAVFALGLRALYALAAWLLGGLLAADPQVIRSNEFTGSLMPPDALLSVWQRFDTLWYLHIAQSGYDRQAAVVFYPLYPGLIRLFHPSLAAALVISTVAAFAFAWGLQELIRLDLPDSTAARALLLVTVWPGSFILFAGYADSLVMALSVWSIYFARTGRWRWAAVLGLFGGFAKAVGALAAVPLAWLAWRKDRRHLWTALAPLLGPAAFGIWIRSAGFGSAAAAYAAHWHTEVVWPWATLLASVRAFPTGPLLRLNLIFLLLATGLALVRGLRTEYRLYALASLALFLTKRTDPLLQSTVRYVLAVFPVYIAAAAVLENRKLGLAVLCAFFGAIDAALLYGFWRWSLLV